MVRDWSSVDFCRDKNGLTRKIVGALTEHIFPQNLTSVFVGRYQKMQSLFSVPAAESEWKQPDFEVHDFERHKDARLEILESFVKTQDLCGRRLRSYLQCPCVGHDLPTWMSRRGNGNGKRIVLLTQDPLRDRQGCGSLTISSPFGFHSAQMRESENSSIMMHLVHELVVNQGYEVYCTDINKLYARIPNRNSCKGCRSIDACYARKRDFSRCKRELDAVLSPLYRDVFLKECNAFKPDLVVVMGSKTAADMAVDSAVETEHYLRNPCETWLREFPFPLWVTLHPSRWRHLKNDFRSSVLGERGDETFGSWVMRYYRDSIVNILRNR